MSMRICANKDCEREYDTRNKKYGTINCCNSCGQEQEKGMTRLGGIMHFSHKTAPEIIIMNLDDAKEIARKTDRTGGQGIIKGMSTNR